MRQAGCGEPARRRGKRISRRRVTNGRGVGTSYRPRGSHAFRCVSGYAVRRVARDGSPQPTCLTGSRSTVAHFARSSARYMGWRRKTPAGAKTTARKNEKRATNRDGALSRRAVSISIPFSVFVFRFSFPHLDRRRQVAERCVSRVVELVASACVSHLLEDDRSCAKCEAEPLPRRELVRRSQPVSLARR